MQSLRVTKLKQLCGSIAKHVSAANNNHLYICQRQFFNFVTQESVQKDFQSIRDELAKERQTQAEHRGLMERKVMLVEEIHQKIIAKIDRLEAAVKELNLYTKNDKDNQNNESVAKVEAELARYTELQKSILSEVGNLSQQLSTLKLEVDGNSSSMNALKDLVSQASTATKRERKEKPAKETKAKEAKVKDGAEESKPLDASRLDLRVGRIVDVQKHPDADSLYLEKIDCGEERPRTVVSGLVKFVPIEDMKQRMVVVLCNLKPAKMRGIASEAMVMCASAGEKVEILAPPPGAVPGDRVTFGNFPGSPDAQLNAKKKIWEQIMPDLSTNEDLAATYKGDPFWVPGKGPVVAQTLRNANVS